MSESKKCHEHGLPDELLYEILLRLPVKSLRRFQCVCSSWYSLISSPQFQNDHYHQSSNNPLILTIKHPEESAETLDNLQFATYRSSQGTFIKNLSKMSPYQFHGVTRVETCLGLLCIELEGLEKKKINMVVFNPMTEEIVPLPPAKWFNFCLGFGYAGVSKEFKVVRFFTVPSLSDGHKYMCRVFTLGGHEWRDSTKPPFKSWNGRAPFVQGALHLLPWCNSDNEKYHLSAFDVESEVYKDILLPERHWSVEFKVRRNSSLSEFGGSLCMTYEFYDTEQIELWLLKDYSNGKWVNEYIIDHASLFGTCLVKYGVIAIGGDGHIFLNVHSGTGCELLCYDPNEKTVTQKIEKNCSATLYVESFLWPGSELTTGGSLG